MSASLSGQRPHLDSRTLRFVRALIPHSTLHVILRVELATLSRTKKGLPDIDQQSLDLFRVKLVVILLFSGSKFLKRCQQHVREKRLSAYLYHSAYLAVSIVW
jgi:hypothetical protein